MQADTLAPGDELGIVVSPTRRNRMLAKVLLPKMNLLVEGGFQKSPLAVLPNPANVRYVEEMSGIEGDLVKSPCGLRMRV